MEGIVAHDDCVSEGDLDPPQGPAHLTVHLHDKLGADTHQHGPTRALLLGEGFHSDHLRRDGVRDAGPPLDVVVPGIPESLENVRRNIFVGC